MSAASVRGLAKYRATDKYKETVSVWARSAQGKTVKRNANKKYNAKWQVRQRNYFDEIKRQFNLSPAQYYQMLGTQNGVCANQECRRINDGKRLSVDHCHRTGKVRGLLCDACNTTLGRFDDDPVKLIGLIRFLGEDRP